MTTVPTELIIDRMLDLPALLARKSYFLLGPRQTGKTTLIQRALPRARVYDLLDHRRGVGAAGTPPAARHAGVRRGFETWLLHELRSWIDYRSGEELRYWRSTSGFEVDFILGDHTAIEVKCKANVGPGDLKGLRAVAEEGKLRRYLCVCLEPRRRRVDGVEVLPYAEFLAALWNGDYR